MGTCPTTAGFSWAHSSLVGLNDCFIAFFHIVQRLLQGYAPVRDPTEDFYMRRMYGRIVVSPSWGALPSCSCVCDI